MTGNVRLEVSTWGDDAVSIFAFEDMSQVGKAYLSKEDGVARLVDIFVAEYYVPIIPFLSWPRKKISHRGKGYGSLILKRAIKFCKTWDVSGIEGEARGDLNFLLPWYKRHGFEVADSNKIYMRVGT